jgi:16S rRNA (cytidine1402-2'-O)-methyltransferase
MDAGYSVTSAPGPSAIITALTLAGLPTDAFFFAGFLPNAKGARRTALEAVRAVPGTLVFYEAPKRVGAMLQDAAMVLGGEREAVICRELTKKFEEVRRGTLQSLADEIGGDALRGEIVVLVDRLRGADMDENDLEEAVHQALTTMSVRDAAESVAKAFNIHKRKVYQLALKLSSDN